MILKMKNFSDLSVKLTKQIDNTIKRQNGIFFTPLSIINKNLELLKDYTFENVLEPSCGSCEFINQVQKKYPLASITGIEFNKTIFDQVKQNGYMNVINDNFLKWSCQYKFDLIIGNPPYYVMKKTDIDKEYYKYFDGRPNIYIFFIIKALTLLQENGILSFILPSNFLNCLYYNKLRKYIYENFKIISIEKCDSNDDKYLTTVQSTIIFIIQNNSDISNNHQYIIQNGDFTLFNTKESIQLLKKLYENTTTITKLNCKINIGTVVWNQQKDKLTNDDQYTRLIYNSDIHNNQLILKKYTNSDKKNYIKKKGLTHQCIILNRGYGTGNYTFDYCLLNVNYEYLLENHIISICGDTTTLQLIKQSFDNPKTKQFIQIYFNNNAINVNELKFILPVYM
jgi:tRNA1(Val) A37 N6-methylase TrmN6